MKLLPLAIVVLVTGCGGSTPAPSPSTSNPSPSDPGESPPTQYSGPAAISITPYALAVTGRVTVLAATDMSPPTIRLSYSYPVRDLGWSIHADVVLAENRPISVRTYGLAELAPQSRVDVLDKEVGRYFALHNLGGDGTMSLVIASASPDAVHGSLEVNMVATTSSGPRLTMIAMF